MTYIDILVDLPDYLIFGAITAMGLFFAKPIVLPVLIYAAFRLAKKDIQKQIEAAITSDVLQKFERIEDMLQDFFADIQEIKEVLKTDIQEIKEALTAVKTDSQEIKEALKALKTDTQEIKEALKTNLHELNSKVDRILAILQESECPPRMYHVCFNKNTHHQLVEDPQTSLMRNFLNDVIPTSAMSDYNAGKTSIVFQHHNLGDIPLEPLRNMETVSELETLLQLQACDTLVKLTLQINKTSK